MRKLTKKEILKIEKKAAWIDHTDISDSLKKALKTGEIEYSILKLQAKKKRLELNKKWDKSRESE